MTIFEYIIALIAPHTCLKCGKEGALLCKKCMQVLPAPPNLCFICKSLSPASPGICNKCTKTTHIHEIRIRTVYQDVAKQLVYKAKFERAHVSLADIAGSLTFINEQNITAVTYVPTANHRVRARGYDHARRIAQIYARQNHLPCLALLARTNNERQAGATAFERRLHMQDAFRITDTGARKPQNVILIDDVVTTGSSVISAANALHDAGVQKIVVAAFAYTLPK